MKEKTEVISIDLVGEEKARPEKSIENNSLVENNKTDKKNDIIPSKGLLHYDSKKETLGT